jgi:predicted Zn-dependent peptidase
MVKSISLVEQELRKLREEPLGKKQLAAAKEQMMGQIAMGEENNVSFMMMMARNLLDQGRITTLDELFSQVKDTSAEDLMTLANEIFKENKFSYLMMEPRAGHGHSQ